MIAFIDDHREVHGVEPICKVLPIAPSTYHDHAAKRADPGKLSTRARQDMALKQEIARVFAENFEVYGARRCCQSNANSSAEVARFVNVMRVYAARIRHSAWAAERPCL